MERSNSKTGFFISMLNFIHVVIVFMNSQLIVLPEEEKMVIISAWFIITVVLTVTGFFLSKKGYTEERHNTGFGFAGIALNGLVMLPAIILMLGIIFSSAENKRK